VDIESGRDLSVDQQGEIMVRGPQIMKGYLNNPAATKETFTNDGWMRTGTIIYFYLPRTFTSYKVSTVYIKNKL
jgi:4-coumarate--CoA ligase